MPPAPAATRCLPSAALDNAVRPHIAPHWPSGLDQPAPRPHAPAAAPAAGAQQQQQQAAAAPPAGGQPFDMFGGAPPAAAQQAAEGGPLSELRRSPQFQALRAMVQQRPELLQPMLAVSGAGAVPAGLCQAAAGWLLPAGCLPACRMSVICLLAVALSMAISLRWLCSYLQARVLPSLLCKSTCKLC